MLKAFPVKPQAHFVRSNDMDVQTMLCCNCLQPSTRLRGCTKCPACCGPWYCSTECQEIHWAEHRLVCAGRNQWQCIRALTATLKDRNFNLPSNVQSKILKFLRPSWIWSLVLITTLNTIRDSRIQQYWIFKFWTRYSKTLQTMFSIPTTYWKAF